MAWGGGLGPGRAPAPGAERAGPLLGGAPRPRQPLKGGGIVEGAGSGIADLAYLTYRAPAALIERLPEPFTDEAAAAIASAVAALARRAPSPYVRHLQRVLGRPLQVGEQRAWLRRAYRNYARYWVEGARLPGLEPEVVEARMSVESGWSDFVDAMAKGNGVVLALPHLGSWEWGGAWLALQGYPMTSVAEQVGSKRLYDFFARQRRRMGLTIVPLGPGAGPVLLQTLRRGGLVGLLCDRDIAGGGVEVEFFGERTTLPAGPATLALRTGATLMAGAVYSGPGEHHTGVLLPPLDVGRRGGLRADVARLTQAVAHHLETLIRRAPDQWYLFQPNWPSDPGWRRGGERPGPAAPSAGPAGGF